jgi:hypothetical protein
MPDLPSSRRTGRRAGTSDDDQHDEGENILIVAAEEAAGQIADIAGAERLDQAEQDAAGIAPARLPMPPSTAAVKALRPSMKPIW